MEPRPKILFSIQCRFPHFPFPYLPASHFQRPHFQHLFAIMPNKITYIHTYMDNVHILAYNALMVSHGSFNHKLLLKHFCTARVSLHFAWVVDDAKCIVVTRVCLCLSVYQSINQSFICSNNNKNMHINTIESSRTARSHKNIDSCPEKECSMTIIQFIITQNYIQENEKSLRSQC